jgi:hypothetical protein
MWLDDVKAPAKFEDGTRLDAVHLNGIVDHSRWLAARSSQWALEVGGGWWGLLLHREDIAGTRNTLSESRVEGLSLVLPNGNILRCERGESLDLPIGDGSANEAQGQGKLAEFWAVEAPRLTARGAGALEWCAPVLHTGAEPALWKLCCELGRGIRALGEKVRERQDKRQDKCTPGLGVAWGSLLRAAGRHAEDPWASPHVLGAALDDLVHGFEDVPGARSPPPPLERNAGWGQIVEGLRARRADIEELSKRLAEWGQKRMPANLSRSSVLLNGNSARVFELPEGTGWVKAQGIDASGAVYGVSETDSAEPARLLPLEEGKEVEVEGRFLHVQASSAVSIVVEALVT